MRQSDQALHVVVDGGGSTTRARIVDRRGNRLASVTTGPANPTNNSEVALGSVEDAVRLAYEEAGLAGRDRRADSVCLALAGVEAFDGIDRLRRRLEFAHVSIHSDIDATVVGALGSADGIVAGVGTGSFFVSRVNGSSRRVGGHGFQISDECSGAWLGRELLRWVVKADDGMCRRTPLVDTTLGRFGNSVKDLVVFSLTADPGEFGRMAPLVTNAAEAGDPLAVRILDSAVDELCQILNVLDAASVGLICITGGLGPIYRPLLPGEFGKFLADPVGDAMDGALHLLIRDLEQSTHGLL